MRYVDLRFFKYLNAFFGLNRGAFNKILARLYCEGIKLYWAKKLNSNFTVMLVGVDADVKDMTKRSIMERITPCPPRCDKSSLFAMETVAIAKKICLKQ